MSLQSLISNGERISYVDLREEFEQSPDSGKHELSFVDLTEDLHNREILCLNNDEVLKGQMGKGTFKCEYCEFRCSRPGDLKKHIPSHLQVIGEDIKSYGTEESSNQEQKMHVCEECGVIFVFTKTKSNQIQIQIYKDDSQDSCEECNNRLIKVGDISKSVKKNIPDKIHTCPYCEKEFMSSDDLDSHMEQHNVDQELLYPDAEEENEEVDTNDDSGYFENVGIKQEKQIVKQELQTSALPEINCKKRNNIKKEKDEVSISKKYKNSKSDAKFRPYACSKCTFRAVEEKTLEKHFATHFIERKFACPHCSYKGQKANLLKNHLRTHSSEKPYGCDECEYRTNTPANLKRHERQHTGEKPYACKECDYAAAQKIALQNHMKSVHS